jgi:acetyl esterase/lipase
MLSKRIMNQKYSLQLTGGIVLLMLAGLSWSGKLLAQQPPSPIEPQRIMLWQGDPPQAGGREAADQPHLMLYRVAETDPTAAVVILPGGGYGHLALGHEGEEIAAYFNQLGITAAICIYRHRGAGNAGSGYGHPVPLLDASRAALDWNIDPERIGIIGFSAGGHLASTVSTHFDLGQRASPDPVERVSSRPDFAILAYPVISLDQPHTHRGSQRNLLGEHPDEQLLHSLSTENSVTDQTPPSFLFHTAEDQAVPAENSLKYFSALLRHGVPAELHVFQSGRHGIGLAGQHGDASAWPQLCAQWLKSHRVIQ